MPCRRPRPPPTPRTISPAHTTYLHRRNSELLARARARGAAHNLSDAFENEGSGVSSKAVSLVRLTYCWIRKKVACAAAVTRAQPTNNNNKHTARRCATQVYAHHTKYIHCIVYSHHMRSPYSQSSSRPRPRYCHRRRPTSAVSAASWTRCRMPARASVRACVRACKQRPPRPSPPPQSVARGPRLHDELDQAPRGGRVKERQRRRRERQVPHELTCGYAARRHARRPSHPTPRARHLCRPCHRSHRASSRRPR